MSRMMRAWHIMPKFGVALGAAAKCGSTMLAKMVQGNHRLPVADARHGRECWSLIPLGCYRVAIVRDPVSRFGSLYANIQQRKRSDQNFYKQLEGLSPWDCFDKLIKLSPDLTYDFHFQPQHLCLGPEGKIDRFVRLEHFTEWWKNNAPTELLRSWGDKIGKYNESKPVAVDEKTADRVRNRYREDQALWEKAWASSAICSGSKIPA